MVIGEMPYLAIAPCPILDEDDIWIGDDMEKCPDASPEMSGLCNSHRDKYMGRRAMAKCEICECARIGRQFHTETSPCDFARGTHTHTHMIK